jgi:Rhodopirellula transposase DDE domain
MDTKSFHHESNGAASTQSDSPTASQSKCPDADLCGADQIFAEIRAGIDFVRLENCRLANELTLLNERLDRNSHHSEHTQQQSGDHQPQSNYPRSPLGRTEERYPEIAQALSQLAEAHAQQEPTFASTIAYTRLTATEALWQLAQQGFAVEQLPSVSTMSEVLNRMGYRLGPVVKAKPKKTSRNRRDFRQYPRTERTIERWQCQTLEYGLQSHGQYRVVRPRGQDPRGHPSQ